MYISGSTGVRLHAKAVPCFCSRSVSLKAMTKKHARPRVLLSFAGFHDPYAEGAVLEVQQEGVVAPQPNLEELLLEELEQELAPIEAHRGVAGH